MTPTSHLRVSTTLLILRLSAALVLSSTKPILSDVGSRRLFFSRAAGLPVFAAALTAPSAAPSAAAALSTVVLDAPDIRAGVELYDVTIGTPPRSVVAVKNIAQNAVAASQGVLPGMVLLKYADSKSVLSRIKNGPYPIVLQFCTLLGEGESSSTPQDALRIAHEKSSAIPAAQDVTGNRLGGLSIKVVRKGTACSDSSQRGDLVEVSYEARIGGRDGPVFDSSEESGNGLYVLGKPGDVLPGVDAGTRGMCVGEVRELDVPSALGFGVQGSRTYLVPPGVRLWWRVELIGITKGFKAKNQ